MTPLQILQEVRTLIAKRENWTQGHYARDAEDIPCAPHDVRAVCWCVEGALAKVASDPDKCNATSVMYTDEMSQTALCLPGHGLTWSWNDQPGRTHTEVLTVLDEAIAKLLVLG